MSPRTAANCQLTTQVGWRSGLEKGLEKERRLVLRQFRKRLGELDADAVGHVETLTAEQLEELGEALLEFEYPDDLKAWLTANAPQADGEKTRTDGP